jgi:hypothetical protein
MGVLRILALPGLQNIVQEESVELVALTLDDLPQMWSRSDPTLMVGSAKGP